MAQQSTTDYVRPARFFAASLLNTLRRADSPARSTVASAFSLVSAAGLVTASAGLGAIYAWHTGQHHGIALATLAVVMALSLELSKAFSVAAAFESFRTWRPLQGLALTVLATVAIAYSLTAELSLMATARGDVVAERVADADAAKYAAVTRQRIEAELKTIGMTRPSATVQAEIDVRLTSRKDLDGCEGRWLRSSAARGVCIEVNQLRAERATADRREGLEQQLSALAWPVDVDRKPIERVADPGAQALATYLAVLDFNLDAALIGQWLVLIPVLALEVGSALAVLLVRATRLDAPNPRPIDEAAPAAETPETRAPNVDDDAAQSSPTRLSVPDSPRERLLTMLSDRGGELFGGQRVFAKALGVSHGTVATLLAELADEGAIVVQAGRSGTRVRLAA